MQYKRLLAPRIEVGSFFVCVHPLPNCISPDWGTDQQAPAAGVMDIAGSMSKVEWNPKQLTVSAPKEPQGDIFDYGMFGNNAHCCGRRAAAAKTKHSIDLPNCISLGLKNQSQLIAT